MQNDTVTGAPVAVETPSPTTKAKPTKKPKTKRRTSTKRAKNSHTEREPLDGRQEGRRA